MILIKLLKLKHPSFCINFHDSTEMIEIIMKKNIYEREINKYSKLFKSQVHK
jgi:hypothetical protein